jgi:hypothetical protein
MRVECHDDGAAAGLMRAVDSVTDHCLMTDMESIENADRKVGGTWERFQLVDGPQYLHGSSSSHPGNIGQRDDFLCDVLF